MKTLIVGNLPVFDEAAAALYAEHGSEIGRLGSLRDVLSDTSLEPKVVLAPLSSAEDVDLLPALVARKVQLLLVADVVSRELRARALEHGAVDVLFPPVSAGQIGGALGVLRGEAPARIARHRAGFPAALQRGGTTIDAVVTNLSSAGFEAEVPWSGPSGGDVLRVALQPPGQAPLKAYGRVLTVAALATGGVRLTARFVGLTGEESDALVDLVDTLPPWPEELATLLETIDALDVTTLRQVAAGQPTPVRLPALTPLEEEALASGWGTDSREDPGIAEAAVARLSGALLADVLEKDPLMPGSARIAHGLARLQSAQDAMRRAASAAQEGDGERLQKVRDLQKRLASAQDRIQRLAGLVKAPAGPQLKTVRATPLERLLERLPPGPAGYILLGSVPVVAVALFLVIVKLLFFPGDAARSTVAENPQLTVMGIRIVQIREIDGRAVAIVDGSWFTANEDERKRMARIARQTSSRDSLEVRDVRGRPLARVVGLDVTLLPLPKPRDTPPPHAS